MILGSFVFHLLCVTTVTSAHPCLVCLCWLGWFLFSVGELNFDLFLTSSNNLTATVESNAATERKLDPKLVPERTKHSGWKI